MNNQIRLNLMQWLKTNDVPFAFLTSTANVFHLSIFTVTHTKDYLRMAVFHDNEPILICPKMEAGQARNAGWEYDIIGYTDIEDHGI